MPRPRQPRENRCGNLDIRVRSGQGGDPGETLFRLIGCEYPYFARYQKPNGLYGEPDPTDIGDDRDPLAPRKIVEPKVKIIPRSPWKA